MREPGATKGALPVEVEGPTTYSTKATQKGITRVDHHREREALFDPGGMIAMNAANKAPVIHLEETMTNLRYSSRVQSTARAVAEDLKRAVFRNKRKMQVWEKERPVTHACRAWGLP